MAFSAPTAPEIHGGPDAHHPARTHRGASLGGRTRRGGRGRRCPVLDRRCAPRGGSRREHDRREILATQGRLFGLNRSEIADRIEQLAPILEMRALDQLVSSYSGGMARRLDLAAALMHNPSVLFLDEPTTGLDPRVDSASGKRFVDSTANSVSPCSSPRSTWRKPTSLPTGSASSTRTDRRRGHPQRTQASDRYRRGHRRRRRRR